MSERARAIAILRQAREVLARRLSQRIVEMEEELLDDAEGLTYCGEIDAIYEQIGLRLSHVNALLAHLPAEEEPAPSAGGRALLAETEPGGSGSGSEPAARYEGAWVQADTAPTAPMLDVQTTLHEMTVLPTPVTFELFARQILCDDLELAGRSLAVLFAVDIGLGRRSAAAFHARLSERPETMSRLLRLRRELMEGGINGPLKLLQECFALEGLEALSVLQTLRARLIGHNEAA